MKDSGDVKKYAALRPDLKISKQVQSGKVHYVVKDPIKDTFFRFDESEWEVICLFDGKKTMKEMVEHYNHTHKFEDIDETTIKEYRDNLESLHLLQKTRVEHNVMLVEKMKDMRRSQLLSKKGSLMYKRFPLVDPDRFFDKVVPKLSFFWSKQFFWFSLSCMALATFIVLNRWDAFERGLYEAFSFSDMSAWNLLFLWVAIYTVIAIHELGHGLTCKYFGGEVHEMGFLLLFGQPCLYCNVNDAWLFDSKRKQVLVTLAGGYIEFFIGSLFVFVWFLTNPNTAINVLSFQIMTVCSISTIFFNFNPLIKLDGYYLLSDTLEIPNLKDQSAGYIKYLTSRYIFRMPEPEFEATKREKRIFFIYGVAAAIWIFLLLTGIFFLVKGLLVDYFYEFGLLFAAGVGYMLFGSQVKRTGAFFVKWFMTKKGFFNDKANRWRFGIGMAILFGLLFVPIPYKVPGLATLEPSFIDVIRASSEGTIRRFPIENGGRVLYEAVVTEIENLTLDIEKKMAELEVSKLEHKVRQAYVDVAPSLEGLKREVASKRMALAKTIEKFENLNIRYRPSVKREGLLSCKSQLSLLNTRVAEGDEICRVVGIQWLKTVIDVTEQQVGFIKEDDEVEFKVVGTPFTTYQGRVNRIQVLSSADPLNPSGRLYKAELLIENRGLLRPGMTGVAKIVSEPVSLVSYFWRRLMTFFRMDLFL